MLVSEFLERIRQDGNPAAAIGFMMDFLTLLDEFDGEKCSVLAGKIRGQMEAANKAKTREPTTVELIELNTFADKLNATGSSVYAIQFDERLQELARDTGLSIQELRNSAREYRNTR